MRTLIPKLSEYNDGFDGYYMVSAIYEEKPKTEGIIKKRKNFAVVCVSDKEHSLTVTLMKSDDASNSKKENIKADFSKIFSKKDIEAYLLFSHDKNTIHRIENPVVPGLLVFMYLCEKFNLKNVSARFLSPIFCNDTVNFVKDKAITGYVNGVKSIVIKRTNDK